MAPKPKGKWATQATVDLGSLIQGLAYMGGQMEKSSANRTASWEDQTRSYLRDFTPPGGITAMTDKVALDNLHNNLIDMDNRNKEGPHGSDWESDTSRDYHLSAMEAVSHQLGSINKIESDFNTLLKSNDNIYISGPQTSSDINYGNLLNQDGELLFPDDYINKDAEGHSYVESARFFETYLDVVNTYDSEGNSGAVTNIGKTMHQILINSQANTRKLLERFRGNSDYAPLLGLPAFHHIGTSIKSVEGIMDYGDSILGNIRYSHGDDSIVDPEFAMYYDNAVRNDDFSATSQLFLYKNDKRAREIENQQSFKQAIDNKHIAYKSYKSILDLTGEQKIMKNPETGEEEVHYLVPDLAGQKKGELPTYTPMTEEKINANIGPTVNSLYDAIIKDQEDYLKNHGHRYEKFTAKDIEKKLRKKEFIKTTRTPEQIKSVYGGRKEPDIDISKDYVKWRRKNFKTLKEWDMGRSGGGGPLDSKLLTFSDSDLNKMLNAYSSYIKTDDGKAHLSKEGAEGGFRHGYGIHMWANELSNKQLSKILNRYLTK